MTGNGAVLDVPRRRKRRSRHTKATQESERKVRGQELAGQMSPVKPRWTVTKSQLTYALVLIILSVAIYLPALRDPFITLDDGPYVTGNQHVLAGLTWSTFKWALTATEMGHWHPLTWLSHSLDVELFGQAPAGHHFSSIAMHAVNSALLFLFLASATGAKGRSWIVAALFAIHPINVESVAWIAERKSVLSAWWSFSALCAYVWYVRQPSWKRYLPLLFSFILALAAKSMAVTLPFVLLLLDCWPLNRVKRWRDLVGGRLLLEKLPLFILSAASSALAVVAQRSVGALSENLPFGWRLQNAIYSCALYVWKIVWPARLAIFYPYPLGTLSWVRVLAAALFLAGVTAFAIHLRRPYLMLGWFWFLGTLVPVIGIVQVGPQGMADRYAYIPGIGIFLMVVWGLDELAGRVRAGLKPRVAVIAAAVLVFSILTVKQLSYWSTNLRLWQHTLAVTKNNSVAEDNVGNELLQAGIYDQAYAHFENALRIDPSDPLANFDIGARFQLVGMFPQAIAHYKITVAQNTNPTLRAQGYENMGAAYRHLGDSAAARESYRKALQYDPQRVLAHSALEEMEREEKGP